MTKIADLRQERARLVTEQRAMLDAASDENRNFTAEEQEKYDKIDADIDAFDAQIKNEARTDKREKELAEFPEDQIDPRQTQGDSDLQAAIEERTQEYARVFDIYCRHGRGEMDKEERQLLKAGYVESRDQTKGSTTAGGYLVPISFQKQLQEHLVQAGTVRQLDVTVLVTASGENLQVPKTTAHGQAAIIGEGSAITTSDETFGQVTLGAYKFARLVKVSEELVEDEAVDLQGFLAREFGRSIGALENTKYMVGSGTSEPTGIVTASTVGVTTASTTAVTADELIDFFYSIGPQYRRQGVFVFSDSALKAIRKLKDSQNRYLVDINVGLGGLGASDGAVAMESLLGKPVFDDPDLAAYGATGNKFGLFGEFSAYWIRDVGQAGPAAGEKGVGGFAVRRLEERYADTAQIGFLAFHRSDGNLIDQTGAVKYIKHA